MESSGRGLGVSAAVWGFSFPDGTNDSCSIRFCFLASFETKKQKTLVVALLVSGIGFNSLRSPCFEITPDRFLKTPSASLAAHIERIVNL